MKKSDLEYYKNLPKKHMGAGVIFFDEENKILILRPNYKDYWHLPGGVVDDDESPYSAAKREVKEELGLEVDKLKFVSVDYVSTKDGKPENLQFIFYGGKLNADQAGQIKIQKNEHLDYKFVEPSEALELVGAKIKRRLSPSLRAIKNKSLYLEDGK